MKAAWFFKDGATALCFAGLKPEHREAHKKLSIHQIPWEKEIAACITGFKDGKYEGVSFECCD